MLTKVWSDDFLTGIDIVDDQHKHLFEIIHTFAARLPENTTEDRDSEGAIDLINQLLDYAHIHFKDEEAWMAEKEYLLLPVHSNMHTALVNELEYTITALKVNEIPNPAHAVLQFAYSWLNTHIAEEDLSFSDFCRNQEVLPTEKILGKRCEIYSSSNHLVATAIIRKIEHPQIFIEKNLGQDNPLRTNEIVKVTIPNVEGIPFAFMARVMGCNQDEMVLFNAKILQPLARRRYPRVSCEIDVEIMVGNRWIPAQVTDISIAGMALLVEKHLSLNGFYPVQFEILNQKICGDLQIIRIGTTSKVGAFCYGAEVKYENDNMITQYVFYLQGEQRSKIT